MVIEHHAVRREDEFAVAGGESRVIERTPRRNSSVLTPKPEVFNTSLAMRQKLPTADGEVDYKIRTIYFAQKPVP